MPTLPGPAQRYCDGLSRRSFLQVGSLLLGGLTLPDLLRAEERAGSTRSHKAVIMVYLSGGLAHQDSFDLKPDAPQEARGEFHPIETNVPGIQICELLPNLAQVADKYTLLRSIVGLRDEHSSFQTITGYTMGDSQRNGYPHFGSVVSNVQGNTSPIVPAFVDMFPTMQHRPYNSPGPGNLGPRFAGVKADGEDLASMKLRFVSQDQLGDRRRLLDTFDQFRRAAESDRLTEADSAYQRAFDVLTSSRLVDALDVNREDPQVRERYGKGSPKHQGDGAPLWNDQLLVARRLIEAGVRCVTVAYGFWDTHGGNFSHLRSNLPQFDRGIAALVQDLHDRGLENDVTVVVWGEFGRTPRINKDAGRDHWPRVNGALLAGGGLRAGQVIGSTDALADSAKDRPIPYQDVLATLYHPLGIDPHEFIRDIADRPVPILPGSAQPIRELI
ncbi:MAG: DUF1501 domain-containing protein [Planctomycetaceae bacterium]|nr:DUF1501 domain-containing protein [Planctomycetaceae bacterium]